MTSFESELHMFEERDLMLDQQVKTYSEGIGPVAPTGEVPDQELVKSVHESQTEVQDPHVVCIEDRNDVEGQPVREKMAGGNVATGYAAAEMAGWSLFTDRERT